MKTLLLVLVYGISFYSYAEFGVTYFTVSQEDNRTNLEMEKNINSVDSFFLTDSNSSALLSFDCQIQEVSSDDQITFNGNLQIFSDANIITPNRKNSILFIHRFHSLADCENFESKLYDVPRSKTILKLDWITHKFEYRTF